MKISVGEYWDARGCCMILQQLKIKSDEDICG